MVPLRCVQGVPSGFCNLLALLSRIIFSHPLLAWVQVWVQLKKEKWLPISRKRTR